MTDAPSLFQDGERHSRSYYSGSIALPGRSRSRRFSGAAEKFEYWTMPEPNSGCLLWCGPVNEQGYGRLYIGKRATRANRWAWKQRHGPIPKGQHVLHKCDVTYCVNVDHFFLGTNAENISDKMRKGRYRCLRGERHPNSKLNENAVRHIRSKVESAACYASLYGVTPELVWMVQGRKIWKHVK